MYLLFTPTMLLILSLIILWFNPAGGLKHTLGIMVLAFSCLKLGMRLDKYMLSFYLKMLKEQVWTDDATLTAAIGKEPSISQMSEKAKEGLISLLKTGANATLSTIEEMFVYGKSDD